MSEANYDWGQGLPDLLQWQRRHHVERLNVWYFGCDPSIERMAFRVLPLHTERFKDPRKMRDNIDGAYLAVSTTLLFGCPVNTEEYRRAVAFLREREPVSRTTTFLIFDFRQLAKSE